MMAVMIAPPTPRPGLLGIAAQPSCVFVLRDLFAPVLAFYCRHTTLPIEPGLLAVLKAMIDSMHSQDEIAAEQVLRDAITCIKYDMSGLDTGVRSALYEARWYLELRQRREGEQR